MLLVHLALLSPELTWPKVYSNSLLATLNARKSIRGLSDDYGDVSVSLQTLSKNAARRNMTTVTNVLSSLFSIQLYFDIDLCQPRPTNISIKIDTTHEFVRDEIERDLDVSRHLGASQYLAD